MAIQPWAARLQLNQFGGSFSVWASTQVYFLSQLLIANLVLVFWPQRWSTQGGDRYDASDANRSNSSDDTKPSPLRDHAP
jgi:hypothetical protein